MFEFGHVFGGLACLRLCCAFAVRYPRLAVKMKAAFLFGPVAVNDPFRLKTHHVIQGFWRFGNWLTITAGGNYEWNSIMDIHGL